MHLDRTRLRNTLLLLLASFLWGTAFVAQSVGSRHMGPYTFLACRSWLGCAFLAVLALVRGRRRAPGVPFWQAPRRLCRGGLICGAVLFAASAAQQMGVGGTSTAKAGFLTALYVVLVPVFGIFLGRRQRPGLWVCVFLSVAGLYLLCMAGRDTLSLTGGEWQLLLCAVLFSWQIMAVGRYSPGLDGVQLSLAQFSVVTVLSTAAALWRGRAPPALLACRRRRGRPSPTAASFPPAWPIPYRSSASRTWTPPSPAWPCAWKACGAPSAAGWCRARR